MASKPMTRKMKIILATVEAASIILVGVGVGIHDLGAGLAAAGVLIWINLTIGGLRR